VAFEIIARAPKTWRRDSCTSVSPGRCSASRLGQAPPWRSSMASCASFNWRLPAARCSSRRCASNCPCSSTLIERCQGGDQMARDLVEGTLSSFLATLPMESVISSMPPKRSGKWAGVHPGYGLRRSALHHVDGDVLLAGEKVAVLERRRMPCATMLSIMYVRRHRIDRCFSHWKHAPELEFAAERCRPPPGSATRRHAIVLDGEALHSPMLMPRSRPERPPTVRATYP